MVAFAVFFSLLVARLVTPMLAAYFSLLIFGLAFYTFFGVPFISTAPHKGAI